MRAKIPLPYFTTLCGLLLAVANAPAQPPPHLNYQGRVSVDGTNFHGTGQFKFALVNATGDTTYWSHDGSSAGGSEPDTAVPLNVERGLYAVALGDPSQPGMTSALTPGLFMNDGAVLRVWFDDGVAGPQQLVPNQALASVGSAFVAMTVPDEAIQASFRVNGGVRFTSGSLNWTHNMTWTPGDSSGWSLPSDVNSKEHFASVDQQQVLQRLVTVPIQEWNYIGYDQRHIGPTAQDFHAAFGDWSNSDTTIDTGHLHGIALASLQALHERNEELAEENRQLRAELDEIRQHLGL